MDERADEHEAEVVVVDVSAGEPGVVGREGRALEDGGEERQIHRLFATTRRVPKVGVGRANEQEAKERQQEQRLARQQRRPPRAREGQQRLLVAPRDQRARRDQQPGAQPDAAWRERHQLQAAE